MRALCPSWRVFLVVGAVLAGCTPRQPPDGSPPDAAASAPDASLPDASLPDASLPDASLPDASLPDASLPDASLLDASLPDAGGGTDAGEGPDAAQAPDGGSGADGGEVLDSGMAADAGVTGYLEQCGSLFAARILEKQIALDATFPNNCNTALRNDIGQLRPGGPASCSAGESPNTCRQRRYDTPPSLTADLAPGCWNGAGPVGCMRGSWLPKCADGTDTSCAEPEVVCQDGTRPMFYAEAATTGPSTTWLIQLGGEGGPCVGDTCWLNYHYAHLANDAPFERAMSSIHPDYATNGADQGTGVVAGNAVAANPFAAYNRVRFKRCSDVSSDAVEMVDVPDGVPPEAAAMFPGAPVETRSSRVPVWHRGHNVWSSLFATLAAGTGLDFEGDGTADLPPLTSATTILLAGSSDASVWLAMAADQLALELRAIAGANVDVRILIDGYFEPTLDNEGRYHANAPPNFNMFSNPYASTNLCQLPDNGDGVANEGCSSSPYALGGQYRAALDARGSLLDASCEAFHGVDAVQCYDKTHTLTHHVQTPFLTLADQEDATVSRSGPVYRHDRSYAWDTPQTYRTRVMDQARDLQSFWTTAAREEGPGLLANRALILAKDRRNNQGWGNATHVRFGDNVKMAEGMTRCTAAGAALNTVSFASMIGAWVANTAQEYYVAEDAASWDGTSPYLVTGDTCRAPE